MLLVNSNLFGQDMLILTDTTKTAEVELSEVVINSSRNSSILKDIPTSISLINSKQVTNNNLQSLEDVNIIAPNFFMVNYGSKLTSPIYIRGIGSKKKSPAVGLYVDGVPFFEISSMNFDFFDISRIEVLRGPQGTLFGRNTMGGLINAGTLSPLNYQGTRIRLSTTDIGNYNASAGYYDKTSNNKFAYSLTGNYRYRKGVFENKSTNDMSDKLQSYGLRNRLAYQINENFLIENIASFENSKEYGYPFKNLKTDEVNYNDTSSYDRLMFNNGLRLDYTGSDFTFESTLSYQAIKDKQKMDQDFTQIPLFFADQDGKQNMVSAEFTIASKNNKQYKWLLGAFSFLQNKNTILDVIIRPKKLTLSKDYKEQMLSGGIFHQSELKLFDRLTLSAGIRYNYEESSLDYKYNQYIKTKLVKTVTDTIYPYLNEHIFLPKISATYSIGKSSVYLLYSTGYKPGGFNLTFEHPQNLQFENQMSHNYEIGYKQTFLNGKIYSDIALFFSDITGQQIALPVASGQGTYLENAGKSENKGIEASLNISNVKGFDVNTSFGYTNSEIIKYEKNDLVNYNGNTAPYVPKYTFNISVAKTVKFQNNNFLKNIRFQADYKQMGNIYWNIENTLEQKSYGLLSANISFATKYATIDFWAKNITDKTYNVYMLSIPQMKNTFYQQGQPRMIGITTMINF